MTRPWRHSMPSSQNGGPHLAITPRVARLTAPTSSASADPYLAAGATVFDDQVSDRVRGGSSLDLFFADLDLADNDDDNVSDNRGSETLIDLGELL